MASEDPPGLLLLEHVNVNVSDYPAARRFYEALGCQQADVKVHMNCGPHTQFHLPREEPAQLWRGDITVAYSSAGLSEASARLQAFTASPGGAEVHISAVGEAMRVQGPWGSFVLREATEAEAVLGKLPTSRPRTGTTITNGVVGIVEVALPVPVGTAAKLAEFYRDTFRFEVQTSGLEPECEGHEVLLSGGPAPDSQHIRFVESATVPTYIGDHFCIYIGDFEGCFQRCCAEDLVYVNPRFTWLDNSRTLEEAQHWQAFRIKDVKFGEELYVEEHEIRSRRHKRSSLFSKDSPL